MALNDWILLCVCLVGWLVGFLKSSSATRLYRGWVPRLSSDKFTCCHTWDRAERPWLLSQPVTLYWHRTKPVGSGRPQQESNPGPPHPESRALPRPLLTSSCGKCDLIHLQLCTPVLSLQIKRLEDELRAEMERSVRDMVSTFEKFSPQRGKTRLQKETERLEETYR